MARLRTNVAFAAGAVAAVLVSVLILMSYLATAPSATVVRLGYSPNVTHAQALYGIATGFYQRNLSSIGVTLQTRVFNAGPTAIGALLANQVDMVFVGPSPTLIGVAVAGPDVLRVVAGGASGGALFVIQSDLNLTKPQDFSGRKFASPQLGNTQDIALKHYLLTQNHTTIDRGGDVDVINAANSDILALFRLRQIDGAWVPEPWATRLVLEGHGKVLLDERSLWPGGQFVTTHLVTTKRYLKEHPDVVQAFLEAEVGLTLLLQHADLQNPDSPALNTINEAITNATHGQLKNSTVGAAFMNMNVTYDPISTSLETYLCWAQQLGFIKTGVTTTGLYDDLTLLNNILDARKLPRVSSTPGTCPG